MQPDQPNPHCGHCGFCDQGLLRLMRCGGCGAVLAICDECELIWTDLAAVRRDPQLPSAGAHPTCPLCRVQPPSWSLLDRQAIEAAELDHLCEPPDEPSGHGVR